MTFCTKCGSKLRDGAKFCSRCGYAVRSSSSSTITPKTTNTRQPIASSRVYDKVTSNYTTTASSSASYPNSADSNLSPQLQENKTNESNSIPQNSLVNQNVNKNDSSRTRTGVGDNKSSEITQNMSTPKEPTLTLPSKFTDSSSIPTSTPSKTNTESGESNGQKDTMLKQTSTTLDNNLEPKATFAEELLKEPQLTGLISDSTSFSMSTARSYTDLKAQIKAKLESLKYNFKSVTWIDEYNATTTFISGSIMQLDWNIENTLHLKAILEKGSADLDFSLHLNKDRPPYDWTNPFQSVE